MNRIRIFTDTNSDLGKDLREAYDIEYLKMCNAIDGEIIPADLEWPRFTPKEFYDMLREGKVHVTTTQVPAEEYRRAFSAALAEGDTVVYVGCAALMSGSINTAAVVARELKAEYPEGKILCVDSKNCCLGEGMMAIYAAELRDAGKSAEEIVSAIEEKRHNVNQFVTVGSLDRLKKSGRVKGSAAFFGNLLGVKPIIISDYNGQNAPICKVKGRSASLAKLLSLMQEAVVAPETQTLYIEHADCEEDAKYLAEQAASLGFAKTYITTINPVVGACIGPDAIGLWAFGKKVDYAI